jgi:predicted phosphodiesterase
MRIALLADIHGNLPALAAVMVELERLQPDYVVLDGDLINGAPFSAEVIEVVRATDWVVVRGNHEFYYLDFGTPRALPGSEDPSRWGQLHWVVERITPEQGAYLGMLPDERTLYIPGAQPVKVAHGVPGRNRVGFFVAQPEATIAHELMGIQEATVISAHTHVQIDRHIHGQSDAAPDLYADPHSVLGSNADAEHHWHLINPGSVGLPLNGDPSAQFALLESVPETVEPGGWRATHMRVGYDRRPVLEGYYSTGMLAAGGVITELFYWELVTAQPEIIPLFRWAHERQLNPDEDIETVFLAYKRATHRDDYVRSRDPLLVRTL